MTRSVQTWDVEYRHAVVRPAARAPLPLPMTRRDSGPQRDADGCATAVNGVGRRQLGVNGLRVGETAAGCDGFTGQSVMLRGPLGEPMALSQQRRPCLAVIQSATISVASLAPNPRAQRADKQQGQDDFEHRQATFCGRAPGLGDAMAEIEQTENADPEQRTPDVAKGKQRQ